MNKQMITFDELVACASRALQKISGEELAEVVNDWSGWKVSYIGDSIFEVEIEDDDVED